MVSLAFRRVPPARGTRPSARIRLDEPPLKQRSALRAQEEVDTMIESPRNARVKEVRKLAQKSERQETGLFVIEGPQAVREADGVRFDDLVSQQADAADASDMDAEVTL